MNFATMCIDRFAMIAVLQHLVLGIHCSTNSITQSVVDPM